MSEIIQVIVPDIGSDEDVDVIEVLVAEGDSVEVDQSLITVESDKASMEIPSSHAGVVSAIKVQLGDKVRQGSLILELSAAGEKAAAPAPSTSQAEPKVEAAAVAAPAANTEAEQKTIVVQVPDIGDAHDVDVKIGRASCRERV